ncbi:annexin A7 isoform X1 [Parasteatoda tepidariorum]|uniref:annexin A7 isoform X1 n=1 Tax=Parasteatoda tepidariorum TaxID=114398 RepID=UPI001C71DFA2|nr:annexin A7 isoform X1 [Parasteatoda tepidariorum]
MAAIYGRGTIVPAENFNAERAAAKLRKAMKGIGTDERAIIDVLVTHSNSQRQEIKRKYKSLYGRDLVEDIQAELGGNFEDICVALLMPQIAYLADCFYDALQGLGTDEKCIIEILCTHHNREIEEIKSYFKQKYNKDLEEWITSDTSGHFQNILRSLASAERDESVEVDFKKAERDAQRLYDGGVNQFGVDGELFTKILCSRSASQLQAIFDAYERIAGHSLTAAIRSEFSGDSKETLLAIVYCIKQRNRYFAKELKECLKGLGTDDSALVRILVSRSEIDLEDIKEAYLQLFKKDIAEDVAADTSGDFRKALLRVLQP